MPVYGIDHVQLAMPQGGEAEGRRFYGELLGLQELAKPKALARRGGLWFACGPLQLHLGVDADFSPAKKAHPGLLVAEFDNLVASLEAAGCTLKTDEPLSGFRRIFTADPFGNRIELLEALD